MSIDQPPPAGEPDPANSGVVWMGLLAHAAHLVSAASVVPPEQEGDRWRRSMPAIIGLQALTLALGWSVERAQKGDRRDLAVACDRAGILIRQHRAELAQAWGESSIPAGIGELVDDAEKVYASARDAGRGGATIARGIA
jgi:hypothetical protein